MSRVETHFGKIKILALGNKAVLDYIKRNNLGDKVKECSWCGEIDFDVEDNDYIVLHKDVKYGAATEHILCKFVNHTEFDEGEDIEIFNQTSPDEYEFLAQFYNGGTCLEEILSNELSKLI